MLTANVWRMAVALAVILMVLAFLVGSDASPVRAQAVDVATPTGVTLAATDNDHELTLSWNHTNTACKADWFILNFWERGNASINSLQVSSLLAGNSSIVPKTTTVEESYTFTMTKLKGGVGWYAHVRAIGGGGSECTSAAATSSYTRDATPKGTGTPKGRDPNIKGPNRPMVTLYPSNTEILVVYAVVDDPKTSIDDVGEWEIEYESRDCTSGTCTSWTGATEIDDIPAGTTSKTLTGLSNGHEYRVDVNASTLVTSSTGSGWIGRWNSNWHRDRYDPSDAQVVIDHRVPGANGPEFTSGASVADQTFTQGTQLTDLQMPTGTGTGTLTYELNFAVPAGLSINAMQKLTGTPTAPLAKTKVTWAVRDSNGLADTLFFTIGVKPKAPTLTGAHGDTEARLTWPAIPGVTKWQVQQDTGSWTDISGSGEDTASHTVTGLTNNTEYDFKVRAVVGAGGTAVIGVESNSVSVTPDSFPSLTGPIADQELTQDTAYTSATAFPAATGTDIPFTYAVANLPTGITLNDTDSDTDYLKLTGTATAPMAKTELTYTATDDDSDTDTLTFNISVAPKATTLSGAAGNGVAHLSWTAIAGVDGWEYLQNIKASTTNTTWTAIDGSGATTAAYKVTGLDNSKEYDFKVRAFVGSGDALVDGVESNKATVDVADQTPALTGTIADQALTQGTSYTSSAAFPAATGGDAPLEYSVASLPSGITLNSDRKLTGTATAPLAKTSFTYTVTDAEGDANNSLDDDTRDTATLTFNISVAPKAVTLSGAPGNGAAHLSWTAIAGVSGWEYLQNATDAVSLSTTWTAITGSGAATAGYKVTGLNNAKMYEFTVRALVGDSSASPSTLVNGVESNKITVDVADQTPTLTGTIADQELTQGTSYTSTAAFPAATGGDAPLVYSVASLPTGITLGADRKLTGTHTSPRAKTSLTYTVTDAEGDAANDDDDDTQDTAWLTFNISVAPKKPTTFAGAVGDAFTKVNLTWDAIAGVTKWQVERDAGSWTDIASSGAATDSHTVTGLTAGVAYDFKVRAVVGTGSNAVDGVESDAVSVTTSSMDYDTDDDGLIEVANLAQLNAIRWDLNGDGAPSSGNEASYLTAFPSHATDMGCPATGCIGYELTADLDFDTNGDGNFNISDDYWNDGSGFKAIGRYTAILDGNGNVIKRLWVRHSDATHLGLFAILKGTVRDLGLEKVVNLSLGGNATVHAGGVAGETESGALIERVYVLGGVRILASGITGAGGVAGGIVGNLSGGTIKKSYVTGIEVDAPGDTISGNRGQAGGIAGRCTGSTIEDTWSDADITANQGEGGLVGQLLGAACTVRRSYAYGVVPGGGGGLIGHKASGASDPTVQYSYWDKTETGRTGDGVLADSFGKTTAELQGPTSNTGIYSNWGTTTWVFLHSKNYPLLMVDFDGDNTATWQEFGDQPSTPGFVGTIADQELTQDAAYTSTAFPAGIGGAGSYTYGVATLPTGITLGSDRKLTGTATSAQGKTELTYTVTDGADDTATLTFEISVKPKKPTTFEGEPGDSVTKVDLSWDALLGVAKWQVKQDSTGSTGSWTDITGSGAATTSHTVTGLTPGASYTFKVRAVAGTGDNAVIGVESDAKSITTSSTDYDTDSDGLIEVASLAQLNAIRWDLNGDGDPDSATNDTTYDAAFPDAPDGMGCPTSGDVIGCIGYELTAGLDFDTNDDGSLNSSDDYWNFGNGFKAIGEYTGIFDGNGNAIRNLRVRHSDATHLGLFAKISASAIVRDLGLEEVMIAAKTGSAYAGAVAGVAAGTSRIERVYVLGGSEISVKNPINPVTATYAGGLVGDHTGGTISKSYVTGVLVKSQDQGYAGGIAGHCYGSAAVTIEDVWTDATVNGAGLNGGLIGWSTGPANKCTIIRAYATGSVGSGAGSGGLVGGKAAFSITNKLTISESYWDKETTGQSTSYLVLATFGKTTAELRAPTSNTGIYANWATTTWDFVHAEHYPVLKVDWDDTSGATWQEFGDQPSTPGLTGTIADQSLTQGTSYTSGTAFPEASDGNGALAYSVASLPSGITLNSARKLTGTATAPLAKTSFTYKVADGDSNTGDSDAATLTFDLSVAPKAVTLSGSPGNGAAHLSWTAIAGVAGWEYLQNEKDATSNTTWATISDSGATTAKHTVTGLDNSKEYDFKVRAHIGTSGTLVNGVASNKATVDVADQTPALTGTIADQELTQGTSYTSGTALPAATGGDAPLAYSVADLPSGITLNDDRKLTGTATAPLAKTELTYTVTDAAGDATNANDDDTRDTATLTFNISVAPQKPADFTATGFDTEVDLAWTAIAGVAGWEVKQGSGSWTAISGSGAATKSHTVTGLTNGTSYTFKVRAYIGDSGATPSTRVDGVESDAKSATPSADLVPALVTIADKTYMQGAAVDVTLPAATGGDSHPTYTYTLTPNVSGIGLTFTASTRKLGGTPSAPKAKVTYTYTATESTDTDGTTESTSKTFTIGIQPKATTLTGAPGNGVAHLSWTAIAGVAGWEYLQNEKDSTTNSTWAAITNSGAATAGHKVTDLDNSKEYDFKVRAHIGSGGTLVNGVESNKATVDVADQTPTLTGPIADQALTQGTSYTSGTEFPAATGEDKPFTYSVANLPSGLTLNSDRKLTGTATAPLAKTSLTYTVTDAAGDAGNANDDDTKDTATLTFNISVAPKKPANFSATPFDSMVTLDWTAIAGVAGWEAKQGSGNWTAITGSGAATNSHDVTGLTNGISHTFKVRAFVGTGDARVNGVESDEESATPSDDLVPVVETVTDKLYVQGVAVDFTLPAATAGDGDLTAYTYTLTPNVSGIGLTFTANTRKLTGTPTAPKAKVSYIYAVTEDTDTDGTTESTSKTFTIGIQPKATTLSGAPGNGAAHLSWTAITGVDGWEYLQNEKGITTNSTWTAITGSSASTAAYTVTGLDNAKEYDFKVRANIGTGDTLVNGVESNKVTVNVADQTPALTGTIADQELTQGTSYTSAAAFPAATGGDAPLAYSVASLPSGVTLNSDRKLTGTATSPLAKTSFTYTVTDAEGDADNDNDDDTRDTAILTFNISVKPKAVTLSGSPGNGVAHLSWTAIAGVSGWEYLQNEKDSTDNITWAAITGSGASTAAYKVTGLDNSKEYDFKVRANIGTGDTLVNGVESNKATVDVADQTPTLTGTIADQALTQGTSYTSGTAFPTGSGGDLPLEYSVASLPSGVTLNSDRKLTGTATAPLAKTSFTYTVTDAAGDANNAGDDDTRDTATLTFNISVAPQKPAGFTAAAGDAEVTLGWTAIAGVSGWEVQQDSGSWTAIASSGAATSSHTVTGLTNGTAYTFKVRAVVGTSTNAVNGVESDDASATPLADLVPVLTDIANQLYVQGAAVDFTLPAATGGDSHPSYTYTLTPDVSGIGLTFTPSTLKLTGTPDAPKAKVSYTYTAAETSDTDGTTESTSKTFTIGIQPKKPEGFTANPSNGQATLGWTAIADVDGWEVKQDSTGSVGSWTAIADSGAATSSHTVTGLTNGTEYTFKVRAFVGTGNARVDGVESDAASATPVAPPVTGGGGSGGGGSRTVVRDLLPVFPNNASIADQVLILGTPYVGETAFPPAIGGDPPLIYSVANLPRGITLDAERKLTGTAIAPLAKTAFTYRVTDSDGLSPDSAILTFNIAVAPNKPEDFIATAGDTEVTLVWTAIVGVDGWEVQQDSGDWVAIDGSDDTTASHTVTGLANATEYAFRVRALIGADNTLVVGVDDAQTVTTPADLVPALTDIADMLYPQGATVDFTLPAAIGGDGHPDYIYTLTPDASGIGLTFDASTLTLSGTPDAPNGRVTYTYTATESADSDGATESAATTFTIGIQPGKPEGFTATAGDIRVTLGWTAIAGVTGWEAQQSSGAWVAIPRSGDTTASHTVTGLANATEYAFRVRAVVGTGDARVDGIESDSQSAATPADLIPALTDIADMLYTQGEAVDFTLPAAIGGDGHPRYVYTLAPDISGSGLTFNESTRTLSGTPDTPNGRVTYTLTATEPRDSDGAAESAAATFTIGIQPRKPEDFAATPGDTQVTLAWTAIPGVSGWELKQDDYAWVAITGSDDATASQTVTGLANASEYAFSVRALVGIGDALVIGVESGALSATTLEDLVPALPDIADKLYVQGEMVDFTLPSATGGDGHPDYEYTLTPNVLGIGLTFGTSSRKLGGEPLAPNGRVAYTYTVTESSDSDGARESASTSFTIGIQPMRPEGFTATAGDAQVTLVWTAIAGVSGWELEQGDGAWVAIAGSDGATASHTVTGLANGTEHTFRVRAVVGTGDARVEGVESDAIPATPLPAATPTPVPTATPTPTPPPPPPPPEEGGISPWWFMLLLPVLPAAGGIAYYIRFIR